MKKWQAALVLLVVLALACGGYVLVQLRSLEVEALSEDLFVLRGLGGNTAVLRTDAGAVIVDTMLLPLQGARIRQKAREITGHGATTDRAGLRYFQAFMAQLADGYHCT